jgi:hypothetical protein
VLAVTWEDRLDFAVVEPHARGLGPPAGNPGVAGVFSPALPTDTFEVVQLFAVAARVVCLAPQGLDDANLCLQTIAARLVAPESMAAAECIKLWHLFARVAQVPKDSLRVEAGKAFCRDLDSLAQRLDLPPLADWDELPQGVQAASPFDQASVAVPVSLPRPQVAQKLRQLLADQPTLPTDQQAQRVAEHLGLMSSEARRTFFDGAVGQGLLGRSEVSLLVRFLIKGVAVRPGDTTLIQVLLRLGSQLTAQLA